MQSCGGSRTRRRTDCRWLECFESFPSARHAGDVGSDTSAALHRDVKATLPRPLDVAMVADASFVACRRRSSVNRLHESLSLHRLARRVHTKRLRMDSCNMGPNHGLESRTSSNFRFSLATRDPERTW